MTIGHNLSETADPMTGPIRETRLPLRLLRHGKVRDVYEVDADRLLLVATDRVSAFDVVMREPVPHKGAVLTQLTAWWLRQLGDRRRASSDQRRCGRDRGGGTGARAARAPCWADGRCSSDAPPCIRSSASCAGYISGSAWKEYRAGLPSRGSGCHRACGRATRSSRRSSRPPPRPRHGHDENISSTQMASRRRRQWPQALERLTRLVYERGRVRAAARGIIIADTKFEFGHGWVSHSAHRRSPDARQLAVLARGRLRAWPHAGELRQAAACATISMRSGTRGDGTATRRRPCCPRRWSQATSARYLDAFRRLTGAPLAPTWGGRPRELRARGVRLHGRRHRGGGRGARDGTRPAVVGPLGRCVLCVLVALWVAYFFRDPERHGDRGDRLVVSPADGRVVMIATVDEPLFSMHRHAASPFS